jgi:hypothetical protein
VDLNNVTLYVFEETNSNFTKVGTRPAYMKSAVLPSGSLTKDVVAILLAAMRTRPSVNSSMLWMHVGGAVSDVASAATAYPHRDASFIFQAKAIWHDASQAAANTQWAAELGAALQPFVADSAGAAYVNYIDPEQPNWAHAYYGANLPRLQRVKQQWDPANLFRFAQGISST